MIKLKIKIISGFTMLLLILILFNSVNAGDNTPHPYPDKYLKNEPSVQNFDFSENDVQCNNIVRRCDKKITYPTTYLTKKNKNKDTSDVDITGFTWYRCEDNITLTLKVKGKIKSKGNILDTLKSLNDYGKFEFYEYRIYLKDKYEQTDLYNSSYGNKKYEPENIVQIRYVNGTCFIKENGSKKDKIGSFEPINNFVVNNNSLQIKFRYKNAWDFDSIKIIAKHVTCDSSNPKEYNEGWEGEGYTVYLIGNQSEDNTDFIPLDKIPPYDSKIYLKKGFIKRKVNLLFKVVFGRVSIIVDTMDDARESSPTSGISYESGINHVDFYVNNQFKYSAIKAEKGIYSWLWNERSFGKYKITVVVYDNMGNYNIDEFNLLKIL